MHYEGPFHLTFLTSKSFLLEFLILRISFTEVSDNIMSNQQTAITGIFFCKDPV